MRVLVTGSRAWPEPERVHEELTLLYLRHGPFVLVYGACATGADAAAEHWFAVAGDKLGCVEVAQPADFEQFGKKARGLRDKELVKTGADLVLAFTGDETTQQMIDMAREAGLEVREITP